MKLEDTDAEDIEISIENVAKKIRKESLNLKPDQTTYDVEIDKSKAENSCSNTLLKLFSRLSPKMNEHLPALLMGNIVTYIITGKPTPLLISLGIVARDKSLISLLNTFCVTCTYDEVLRFRASSASAAADKMEDLGLMTAENGLVQVVANNFDASISSPNGIASTHALAILVTQNQNYSPEQKGPSTIRRLGKLEVKKEVVPDISTHFRRT